MKYPDCKSWGDGCNRCEIYTLCAYCLRFGNRKSATRRADPSRAHPLRHGKGHTEELANSQLRLAWAAQVALVNRQRFGYVTNASSTREKAFPGVAYGGSRTGSFRLQPFLTQSSDLTSDPLRLTVQRRWVIGWCWIKQYTHCTFSLSCFVRTLPAFYRRQDDFLRPR